MSRRDLVNKSIYGEDTVLDEKYVLLDDVKEVLDDIESRITEVLMYMGCKYGFSDLDDAKSELKSLANDLY